MDVRLPRPCVLPSEERVSLLPLQPFGTLRAPSLFFSKTSPTNPSGEASWGLFSVVFFFFNFFFPAVLPLSHASRTVPNSSRSIDSTMPRP